MTEETLWLVKLLLAHLLTDFVLQPSGWVEDRKQKKLRSVKLYLHGFITTLVAWVFIGFEYWLVASAIFVTHIAIDAWKSYQPEKINYFIADQVLHLVVIVAAWCLTFFEWEDITEHWEAFTSDLHIWTIGTAVIFLTTPAGILIGQFTKKWREKIADAETLANAGKWIGIAERLIVFILVLNGDYSAIGLLVAAKGIIRFNEKDRPEIKTEYLVIGTLASIGIAIIIGIITNGILK